MKMDRVLVLEDDLTTEALLTSILLRLNRYADITWIKSADFVIDRLRGESYDLILADFFLDGKTTGLDVWRFCTELCPEVPFILMSGMSITEYCAALGTSRTAPPFLAKPLRFRESSEFIKDVLI